MTPSLSSNPHLAVSQLPLPPLLLPPQKVMERARTKHGELEAIEEKKHSKVQAKLQERLAAKRRAPGEGGDGADGEGAGAEDVPGEPPPPPAGVAARVRARLTSEYEQRPGEPGLRGAWGGASWEGRCVSGGGWVAGAGSSGDRMGEGGQPPWPVSRGV